jgi:8-oxo-dGTP diphosphatase
MQNIVLIEKSFMKRDYPNRPIVAVGVVVLKQNNVLLIRRNKPPKSDMWSIPGGAQTLGEKLIETAHREIKEEAGIEIENLTLIDALDFIDHDDDRNIKFHYSLIDYVADYKDGTLKAGDDAQEAKWVTFNDLEHYNLWSQTLNVIMKAKNTRDMKEKN